MDKFNTPKFQEEYTAKIPALTLLTNLGWQFLPPDTVKQYRNGNKGKHDHVILTDILREQLHKRRFHFAGATHPLSDNAIDKLIQDISTPSLNEGLLTANQKIYEQLLYGISVTEFIDGKKANPTIELIDWHNIDNNSFTFCEEFTVSCTNGIDHRRPDIICFVNGIPLVVIEAKRPDSKGKKSPTINEGISQCLRNQRHDEIPLLFAYSQLLLSINGKGGRYGTCGTPAKFWATWQEEDISDSEQHQLKNIALSNEQANTLFNCRNSEYKTWYDTLISGGELAVTEQDKLIISLLRHDRLLDMVRYFTLFDKRIGKIVARYQQVFGIKRLIERISQKTARKNGQFGRDGGVIWHTTGSGKSFTMVFLSKALILHEQLKQCRLLIVTDRIDLENQLSNTFSAGGELASKKDKVNAMATSGTRLAEQIGKGNERIVFSLIQKFNSATQLPECHNESADIIVLVDEGHRSHGEENNTRMQHALPNASFIAFTGTPLLKDNETTKKFGSIIHSYTMQQAVKDKTVTPLLYEERKPDLEVNERAIDTWFERITIGLNDKQQADLKRKYAKKGQVYSADDRIRLIALDIANHFVNNIDDGLKAQLACDSKASAIKYKKYLDEVGLFESAVVISAPDSREGNRDVADIDGDSMDEVNKWWKDNVGKQEEKKYTEEVVKRFDKDDDLKLLIVVDKLLTGFDEPKNTVLYIDKPLKSHNLIQAIARVNRLHPKKEFGLLIDYRGILSELDTTIEQYQDLAERTQGGFDIDDIAGLYEQMSSEYKKLPRLYKQLWAIFANVKNQNDTEQLRQVLIPKIVVKEGELVDVHLKIRDDFYEALSEFASCLKVALQSVSFFEDNSFSDSDREHYKETVKQFSNLRQVVKEDLGETIDYDEYAEKIKKLLDKHVLGVDIKESEGVYHVNGMGDNKGDQDDKKGDLSNEPKDWSDDKTRNETDIIKTRLSKKIEVDLQDDPYAQQAFSLLLRQAIAEAEAMFDYPLKQHDMFAEFEKQVEERKLDEIPAVFTDDSSVKNKHAQAYYGVIKTVLPDSFGTVDVLKRKVWIDKVTDLAFEIDDVVTNAVSEYSINPKNIENAINKQLLPTMFKLCKDEGGGMEQAKEIVAKVVQIVRVGLSNAG